MYRMTYREWKQQVSESTHLAPLSSLFLEPFSGEDRRGVFEVLVQTSTFRRKRYEVTAWAGIGEETEQLSRIDELLN